MKPTEFEPEFDCPFLVTDEDNVVPYLESVYAPMVWHDVDTDIDIDSDGWEALTGFTGQYSYNGAVMHASEQFSGGLRHHVMSHPGIYVLCVVETIPERDSDDSFGEPAGWCVLKSV